ncbi:hypothetical protein BDZ97DRAFT_586591 [Flammula alnicola]|nr:hypothetical protein BDZ97DRAFT_586591 [Flammula alnicola]
MAPTTCASSCTCHHGGRDHSFVRCGCPNDRPATHPMHINNDAFHHVWCNICVKYCYTYCTAIVVPFCVQALSTESKSHEKAYVSTFTMRSYSPLIWRTVNFELASIHFAHK